MQKLKIEEYQKELEEKIATRGAAEQRQKEIQEEIEQVETVLQESKSGKAEAGTQAIDRSLQEAIKSFGLGATVALVEYLHLLFLRSHELVFGLQAELPKDDINAWHGLQSRTFTGNTPFDGERIYPLTDEFMGLLAPLISSELERTGKSKRLSWVPRKPSDFHKATWPEPELCGGFLPDEIHEAVHLAAEPVHAGEARGIDQDRQHVVDDPARARIARMDAGTAGERGRE